MKRWCLSSKQDSALGYLIAINDENNTTPLYISGFAQVVILKGGISLNGAVFSNFNRNSSTFIENSVTVTNPIWLPALPIITQTQHKKKLNATKAKDDAVIDEEDLRRKNLMEFSQIQNVMNSWRFYFKSKLELSEIQYIATCSYLLIVVGISVPQQEWMIAAEDQSIYINMVDKLNNTILCETVQDSLSFGISIGSAIVGTMNVFDSIKQDVLQIHESWSNAVDNIMKSNKKSNKIKRNKLNDDGTIVLKSPRIIICGAKGVGKSTCLRYTINRLLTPTTRKVCVIDCDAGQPEFSVPGVISLHVISVPILSPSHLNLRKAELSFFMGDITTKNEPEMLIKFIKLLYQRYIEIEQNSQIVSHEEININSIQSTDQPKSTPLQFSTNLFSALEDDSSFRKITSDQHTSSTQTINYSNLIPLVVNTDGFVRFMGAEVLIAICSIINPTNIFHICTEKDKYLPAIEAIRQSHINNDIQSKLSDVSCVVSTIEPGRSTPSKIAGVDLRCLRLVSYFLRNDLNLKLKVRSNSQHDRFPFNIFSEKIKGLDNNINNAVNCSGQKRKSITIDQLSNILKSNMESQTSGLCIRNGCILDNDGIIAMALLKINPLILPFENIQISINNKSLPPSMLLAALNLSVVGISTNHNNNSSDEIITKQFKYCLPNLSGNEAIISTFPVKFSMGSNVFFQPCEYIGIVRAVDPLNQQVILISPNFLDQQHNKSNIALLKGSIQLPNLLIYSSRFPIFPYLSSESNGEGSYIMKGRSNMKRRSQERN
eukprot:gene7687-10457_t